LNVPSPHSRFPGSQPTWKTGKSLEFQKKVPGTLKSLEFDQKKTKSLENGHNSTILDSVRNCRAIDHKN